MTEALLITSGCKHLAVASLLSLMVIACRPMEATPLSTLNNTPATPEQQGQLIVDSSTITNLVAVRKGDTLYAVTRRYKVPMKALITTNQLHLPCILRAGQVLILPPRMTHIVEKSETLYGIAHKYDTAALALAHTNGLLPPYKLLVGQMLSIPSLPERWATRASLPHTNNLPTTANLQENASANSAKSMDVTNGQTKALNNVAQNNTVGGTTVDSSSTHLKNNPLLQKPKINLHLAEATMVAQTRPITLLNTNIAIPPPLTKRPQKRLLSQPQLLWPITGRLVSRYGVLDNDGAHSDGINIAAPRGTPVRAADNGIVVYVGSELKNFGNLLLIRHTDNLLTAYAHHDNILVRRGDAVKRGQIVGTVGTTGDVRTPQLHFEVRQGIKAVDPVLYLEPI